MDAGYRGLHRDHPAQVSVPPRKPGKDAAPEVTEAREQARHGQSSTRICVEHAIADSKNWRSLQRWTGRREDLPETIQAIGSLVSDPAAARSPPGNPGPRRSSRHAGQKRTEPNYALRRYRGRTPAGVVAGQAARPEEEFEMT